MNDKVKVVLASNPKTLSDPCTGIANGQIVHHLFWIWNSSVGGIFEFERQAAARAIVRDLELTGCRWSPKTFLVFTGKRGVRSTFFIGKSEFAFQRHTIFTVLTREFLLLIDLERSPRRLWGSDLAYWSNSNRPTWLWEKGAMWRTEFDKIQTFPAPQTVAWAAA